MKYSLDMRVLLYSNESLTSHVKENLKQNVAYFWNEESLFERPEWVHQTLSSKILLKK